MVGLLNQKGFQPCTLELYKGNHKVLPLDHLLKGSLKVRVVRTLAFPNGNWQFPLKATGPT